MKLGGLWPLDAGGRLRSYHVVRELSERHAVTVLTTHGPGEEAAALAEALPRCETVSFPHAAPKHGSAAFAAALLRSWLSPLPVDLRRWRVAALQAEARRRLAAGAADLCVADFLTAVPNLPVRSSTPVVLFEHNVEHVIWRRLAEVERRPWRRLPLELEWRRMRRFEGRACAGAALTVAVSEADRRALAGLAPQARVEAMPTGVDTGYFHPNGTRVLPGGLVFSGSMDWYPNEDAMLHFVTEVLGRIREEVPDASLTVAGRNPSVRLRSAAEAAGVRVTGTVADVRPFVAEAAVFVVPLRVGGGTRLKILEALAMGKAVVSTTVGAEGLPLEPGVHYLRADDPETFARAVVSLLLDPVQREALGEAGRRLVLGRHSWARAARAFEELIAEVSPCV
ncbi:MAG: glycosyltransferase [Acidobacteria bacterium]|nr:glycosyltransferase [Acidobacteriota bacterium]